ncbi:MAG: TonB-dependent siderophore receptor [Pseudomonadota bacterium]
MHYLAKSVAGVVVVAVSFFSPLQHTVSAQPQSATNPDQMEEVLVVAERLQAGYLERQAEVGLGFPADISRIPQSIQVVNKRLLDDLNPATLSDIVSVAGGVSSPRNSIEPFSSFKMRGFAVRQTVVDGIRNTNSLNIQAEGLASFEQVEVLRGPGGAVFGLSSPGGVVNIVTKKPLSTRRVEASIGIGNFSNRQVAVDVTGPLNTEGSLRGRIVGAYEDRDSFVDFVSVTRAQFNPSIEWEHASGTVLRYQGDYRDREGLRYISLPLEGTLINTDAFELPYSLFTGEPGQGDTESEAWVHTLVAEKRSDGPDLARFYVRYTDTEYNQPSVAAASVDDDGRTLNRRFNQFIEAQEEIIVGAQFVKKLSIGGISPVISAGIDYAEWTYDSEFFRGTVAPLDLLEPEYGAPIDDIFLLASSSDQFEQVGGYLQSVIELDEGVTILIGARVDRLDNTTGDLSFTSSVSSSDTEFSPRFGASWEVTPGVVPYVSYSETFESNPNFGFVRSPDGSPFGPQTGRQWEAGVKLAAVANFTSTLALFEIEQSNVLTPDPSDPFFRVPTGEQRSRGIELLNTWQPIENLTLLANYAYTDAEVTKDNVIESGTPLDNVPEHTGRVWVRYARELGDSWIGGITAGWTHNASAFIGIGSDLKVPSYDVFEFGAFVRRGAIQLDLKVDNLTDEDYLLRGGFGGNGVIPGDQRRVLATLAWNP